MVQDLYYTLRTNYTYIKDESLYNTCKKLTQQKMHILNSKQIVQHLFAGGNIQQTPTAHTVECFILTLLSKLRSTVAQMAEWVLKFVDLKVWGSSHAWIQ